MMSAANDTALLFGEISPNFLSLIFTILIVGEISPFKFVVYVIV